MLQSEHVETVQLYFNPATQQTIHLHSKNDKSNQNKYNNNNNNSSSNDSNSSTSYAINFKPYGWLSKLWSLFGSLLYYGP